MLRSFLSCSPQASGRPLHEKGESSRTEIPTRGGVVKLAEGVTGDAFVEAGLSSRVLHRPLHDALLVQLPGNRCPLPRDGGHELPERCTLR
jgi:hypothetical protein